MYSAIREGNKLSLLTSPQPCLRFSLPEIQAATKNFDDKQGESEFRAEIEVISKLRHPNLVSLIGFCDDNNEMILVYEYMPHGTLYHHLHEADTRLSWVQRLNVAIGAARGMDYLHKGGDTNHGVIHRDVKSSNILLDENWGAVISDFGLSKIVSVDRSIYTSAKGSFGYMDPEYLCTGKLIRGTDVYAFGVVLFELLSGRLAVDLSRGEESSLVRWAKQCMKERKLDQMIDGSMRGTISLKCLGRFVKIADRCLLSDPKERPAMNVVVASLEELLQVQKKWDNSAKSSVRTVFSWMIPMFRSSTKENQDQRRMCSTENNIDRASLTNKETVARGLKMFTVDELRRATRSFAEDTYMGSWSYGEVYKGWVDKTTDSPSKNSSGMPVLIKSLCWNTTVKLEKAKLELEILKEFSHPNLVKLIGYCLSDKQLFLVNEVMPNGNFEDHLYSGTIARLPWVTKVKIAVGIARGIVFLHKTQDYVTTYMQWGSTTSTKLSDCEVTKLARGHYPYTARDDNGLVYGDYYPAFKPFQLQSNLDGFTLVLVEVLTGKQISYDKEVEKMDDLLVQHGKMSIRHIAKLCLEICNEEDAESQMLALLEEHEMYIFEAFATATTESCLINTLQFANFVPFQHKLSFPTPSETESVNRRRKVKSLCRKMLTISPPISRISNLSVCHHLHSISRLLPPPPLPSNQRNSKTLRLHRNFQISAIDAAQPFDYESKISDRIAKSKTLKIAIVGFGNFGQFLAKTLVRQGHSVLAHSRTDYSAAAAEIGVSFYSNADDLCEEHPEVILLCTSILSTDKVLRSLPLQRLKRSTLFVDVLSVKEFAKDLFLQILPLDFDILCTHPMFGPESGKNSWKDLPFVYDKVRIGSDKARVSRCEKFLDSFAREGCVMKEMTCAEHDQHAAESQFITHTVGRVLEKLNLDSTPINTKGYERLLDLVENTSSDSFELYYGLFMYNKNAMEQLERLDLAFESLKKELFGHLHDVLRKQLFGTRERSLGVLQRPPALSKLPTNGSGGLALLPQSESESQSDSATS
ncbi:hypothetical protein SSX86_005086 [Deinandra increscens subsp. villosa]|uniref:Protein kinase domain-containing protein n=1 Tax=Deinandra increscens subsp. villosa TaxID=3103831 RepID=A0AAP0H9P8_9ASTR